MKSKELFFDAAAFFNGGMRLLIFKSKGLYFHLAPAKMNDSSLTKNLLLRSVGNINFSDALRRTRMSTEAHYLLALYAFEELQYRRYEWKCDSLNAPSIQTAKRLGFKYEGTFRNAVIYKNRSRNTNWFSMVIEEWPLHKQALTQWLAEENFDDKGVQVQRLEAFKQ